MQATNALAEAGRLMTICNACRYCEGLCAVFPAMEMRRAFSDGDLTYLANLCHGCGACYIDCQFSPPHEFDVNVPQVFAQVRAQSYEAHAWPGALRGLFRRNGLATGLIMAMSIAAFAMAFLAMAGMDEFFSAHTGSGAFYWLMPHNAMASLFGGAFALTCLALVMGMRNFHRRTGAATFAKASPAAALGQAAKNTARLRYLDGGGAGCYDGQTRRDRRRLFHHFTFYGFLLCFASTCVATLYHFGLHREAPYPWYDLPVLLGVCGGLGLIIGPIGLLLAKRHQDPALTDDLSDRLNGVFLCSLLATSLTGFALLLLRGTGVMSLLLSIHLGVVLAFFVTLPYGKFVHGLYRFAALVRYGRESQTSLRTHGSDLG